MLDTLTEALTAFTSDSFSFVDSDKSKDQAPKQHYFSLFYIIFFHYFIIKL